jgi:hypothetical protein
VHETAAEVHSRRRLSIPTYDVPIHSHAAGLLSPPDGDVWDGASVRPSCGDPPRCWRSSRPLSVRPRAGDAIEWLTLAWEPTGMG